MIRSDLSFFYNDSVRSSRISGQNEMRRSAVAALLFEKDGELHFIFEKRSQDVRQPGEICFPGGSIKDDDSSPREAAIRETEEELGIPRNRISVIGHLGTHIAAMGAMIDCFVARADIPSLDNLVIDRRETQRVFSVPVSFFETHHSETYETIIRIDPSIRDEKGQEKILFPAKELGLPEKYHSSWGNYRHRIFVYRVSGETIWGITAQFIYEFVQTLKNQ
jgi:peroxisomal coenzyme A diphosphatase NUDT7